MWKSGHNSYYDGFDNLEPIFLQEIDNLCHHPVLNTTTHLRLSVPDNVGLI